MKTSFEIKEIIPTTAEEVYIAWLSSEGHTNMTGGEANCSDIVGEEFDAWDGYISGKNTHLVPNKEIKQSWRTAEFDDADNDSDLTILLNDISNGCEITIIHTNIPVGQPDYKQGWIDHYLTPMKECFGK